MSILGYNNDKIFDYVYNKRLEIIEDNFKRGAPTDPEAISAINSVLTNMEKAILDKLKAEQNQQLLAIKKEESQNKEAILAMVMSVLNNVQRPSIDVSSKRETTVNDVTDLVEGELSTTQEFLTLTDIQLSVSKDNQ